MRDTTNTYNLTWLLALQDIMGIILRHGTNHCMVAPILEGMSMVGRAFVLFLRRKKDQDRDFKQPVWTANGRKLASPRETSYLSQIAVTPACSVNATLLDTLQYLETFYTFENVLPLAENLFCRIYWNFLEHTPWQHGSTLMKILVERIQPLLYR